ncbi:MAG TPA: response regulator [Candidatus Hydrogenedentes bacterium]|nr:response regulator [Candidatus Hydrogenedentota bacterium]HPG66096.1 response regulator [Candidatus Hydrogenedentota bacterium]
MRTLVAEDDATSRMILEGVLKRHNFDVVTVADGRSALDLLLSEEAPRLAILDWMMPEMDGVDVCRELRRTDPTRSIYIILLTTRDLKEDVVKGLEAGANDYVTKPFDKEELVARLRVGQRVVELEMTLARRVTELEHAIAEVRTLQGILPICVHCHKIRTDDKAWLRLEAYIQEHSEATFSHAICPECARDLYPELAEE